MGMETALLARQSIFNQELDVVGYELLVKQTDGNLQTIDASDEDTVKAVVTAICDVGLDKLIANKLAFVNCSGVEGYTSINDNLPSDRVVVEVFQDKLTPEALKHIVAMRAEGYKIALRDFTYGDHLAGLLKFIDIVKVDVRDVEQSELEYNVKFLQNFDVELLAEKVEDYDMVGVCYKLGFKFLQGNFLHSPNLVESKKVKVNKLIVLQLLTKLQKPDVSSTEVEEVLSHDPRLSYKLLRIVNSAAFGLQRQIQSLREAIIYLGLQRVRSWASMLSMSASESKKPDELMMVTLTRAKMCEHLAMMLGRQDSDSFFTIGLFSLLDAMLDQPMDKLLAEIDLDEDVKNALLKQEGPMGMLLSSVIAYENADWGNLAYPGLTAEHLRDAYLMSLDWAEQSCALIYTDK